MRELIRRRKAPLLGGGFLILAIAASFFFLIVHQNRPSPTDSYFDQLQKQRLNEDSERNLEVVRPFLESTNFADFSGFEKYPPTAYKYSIAFLAYAVANIGEIDGTKKAECAQWIDNLIQRMIQPQVYGDWMTNGWGNVDTNLFPELDSKLFPVMRQNIMWKGHLNLMYALHIQCSGSDAKYGEYFHSLSENIASEMRNTQYGGACCQSINYYLQCNTISMLSLRYHDLFYGTKFQEKFESRWLNFARKRMFDSKKQLFYAVFHPESGVMDERLSAYTNAWIILYLHFFDPKWADEIYPHYKDAFIRERFGFFAFSVEETQKDGEPPPQLDSLATLFGVMVAKEMGDRPLFEKLLNLLSKAGRTQIDSVNPELAPYRGIEIYVPSNVGIQGPLLFGKVNIGVKELFERAKNVKLAKTGETIIR